MLLTQKFHSLNEIDPEFITSLENLLHEEWPDFQCWKADEQNSPVHDTYTYWLFFGPTHNAPVGVTQLCLRKLNPEKSNVWWRKVGKVFGIKSADHRLAAWSLGSCTEGPALFDPRFSRSGREKFWELQKEVEARPEVIAESIILPQGWGHPRPAWNEITHENREVWQGLRPMDKRHKLYQDYLGTLPLAQRTIIQNGWKKIHDAKVKLGDFPTLASREDLLKECPDFDQKVFSDKHGGLLTFQKDNKLLGALHFQKGQQGTWFFEPIPLETQGSEVVDDQLYVQYALLKWHEISEARKLVVVRHNRPLRLTSAAEEQFFTSQGFATRSVEELTWARDADMI